MLPDLPSLKSKLREAYVGYVSRRAHSQIGIFNEVPKQIVHEGESMRVLRPDGTSDDTPMMRAQAELQIREEEAQTLTHEQRMKILNDLADQMARDMSTKLFSSLSESLDKAGQSVDNRGKPLDAEAILKMFEKMQFDFDEQGRPIMPTLSVGPDVYGAAQAAFEQLTNDPVWRSRLANLMAQKRADWRDREASRKLVG